MKRAQVRDPSLVKRRFTYAIGGPLEPMQHPLHGGVAVPFLLAIGARAARRLECLADKND
ncbi:hypothetical protein N185_18040 [Sinorhizobium sp. GW3]|nr:hypothetical protein N185_18040 [Sinorhizobium sp. GW3]